MKLLFSIFFLMSSVYARPIIVLSGQASLKERKTIKHTLVTKVGVPALFIENDFSNQDCRVKKESVIQICFNHYNFKIIHQNKKILRGALSRVIRNKKSLQAEGLGNL